TGEIENTEETYCYGHPKTPTKLRCSRCERPICGRCAIPASVGQHCPECVAEAKRSAPKVRAAATANAPAIVAIIAITVVSFLAQQMLGNQYTFRLASIPQLIAQGEWYRLFSPVLVHAGFLHLGMNMFVLYVYGQNAEEAFGSVRFVAIYIASALAGSAFSYAFSNAQASVGASGAVFGVVGALIVYLYNRRSSQFIAQHLRGMMGFLGINFVIGLVLPQIDVMAHLGGLIGGLVLGFAFDRSRGAAKATSPLALQLLGLLVVVAGAVALVITRTNVLT
ncbi:MAG: rhomboid family intramembrane serine protease, partial [Actinomycetota bacterium]|nr:rhomboid family intramembrane serine protease [Actinomycetota bacterium]